MGNQSESAVRNKISSMVWKEKGSAIDPFYSDDLKQISTFNVKCSKFNVSGSLSADDIMSRYTFNLGQFGVAFAYRNSDNSLTIVSLSSDFMLGQIVE